jgi:signal transduction histidine kinase
MPVCRRVDISLLLNELKTALAGELSAHAAELEFDAPSTVFPIDPDLLRQILRNLIQNSIEAGADRITLSARLTPNQLQMDIRDNGRGIEPGLQAGIFQPYISGKTKGTGLGLFVVRRLITAMNGSVSLQESRPGYTHFSISLPGGDADEQ